MCNVKGKETESATIIFIIHYSVDYFFTDQIDCLVHNASGNSENCPCQVSSPQGDIHMFFNVSSLKPSSEKNCNSLELGNLAPVVLVKFHNLVQ